MYVEFEGSSSDISSLSTTSFICSLMWLKEEIIVLIYLFIYLFIYYT